MRTKPGGNENKKLLSEHSFQRYSPQYRQEVVDLTYFNEYSQLLLNRHKGTNN